MFTPLRGFYATQYGTTSWNLSISPTPSVRMSSENCFPKLAELNCVALTSRTRNRLGLMDLQLLDSMFRILDAKPTLGHER
jgi:hypothetical protein